MFPFCSVKVKPHLPTGSRLFPSGRPPGYSSGRAVWKSGKSVCWKVDGVGKADRQAPRSRDDIRRDLVFDEGDAVAQLQFAFLQPLQPQQVRRRRLMQRVDRRIEITMLLLQPGEFVFKLALIIVGHGVR